MSVDYSVFDSFCKVPTWNTTHALDEKRFMVALDEVVREPDFHPDDMRAYIDAHAASPVWPISSDERSAAIDRLITKAEAVRAYLGRNR